jgi:hypothetical protein
LSLWEKDIKTISKEIHNQPNSNLLNTVIYMLNKDEIDQKFEEWSNSLTKIKSGIMKIKDNFEYVQDEEELVNKYQQRIFDLRTTINHLISLLNEKNPQTFIDKLFNE